jgi:hypothetical protein
MGGEHGSAQFDWCVERDASFAHALTLASLQMKIIREKGFRADVNAPEFAEQLRVCGNSAAGFVRRGDLDHCSADRSAHRAFDERQALIIDEHRPSQHADRCSVIDAVLER